MVTATIAEPRRIASASGEGCKRCRGADHTLHSARAPDATNGSKGNFILSLGPWVKVLKPATLRDEVAALARETSALYDRP